MSCPALVTAALVALLSPLTDDGVSPVDRARQLDPANDVGLLAPRADTIGAGAVMVHGIGVGLWNTLSYGPSARTQVSVSLSPALPVLGVGGPLPVGVSGKWAIVRGPDYAVSAQVSAGGIAVPTILGGSLGALVDWRPDDAGAFGLHGAIHAPIAFTPTGDLDGVAAGAFVTLGASLRPTDWMVLAVDAVALGTPGDLLGSTVAGAMRLAGSRLAIDLGVMWTAVGDRVLPLVNFAWRS